MSNVKQRPNGRVERNSWPIIGDTPLGVLKEMALAEVRLGARQNGYRITGHPLVSIEHGTPSHLHLSVMVVKQ